MWCWPCHAPNCDVVAELFESLPLLQRERTSCMHDKVCVDVCQQCASFRSGLLVGLANWMKFCGDTRRQMAFSMDGSGRMRDAGELLRVGPSPGRTFWGSLIFQRHKAKSTGTNRNPRNSLSGWQRRDSSDDREFCWTSAVSPS